MRRGGIYGGAGMLGARLRMRGRRSASARAMWPQRRLICAAYCTAVVLYVVGVTVCVCVCCASPERRGRVWGVRLSSVACAAVYGGVAP